jgi:hypothetical protein
MTPIYQRPVEGSLHVHLANGETWEATQADLAKFGLVERMAAYTAFREALSATLARGGFPPDASEAAVGALRYLVETTVAHGEPFTPDVNSDDDDTATEILAIERTLRAAWGGTEPPSDMDTSLAR